MSELVETALRLLFRSEKKSRQLPRLPTGDKVGIPVKVNSDSSGKPNGVLVKANSRRSEATLAC